MLHVSPRRVYLTRGEWKNVMANNITSETAAQDLVDHGPMNVWRIAAVTTMVVLGALDGYDVMSISYAAPLIARDWQLRPDTLGLILSAELVGMALGSILLGLVADRMGRRPVVVGCLSLVTAGMALAFVAGSALALCAARAITGIGVGGMLTTITALTAELANKRWRNLSISLMFAGLPIGGILGGLLAKFVLLGGEWRDIFLIGAIASAAFIPLFLLLVPESIAATARQKDARALARVNRTLRRFNLGQVEALPAQTSDPLTSIFTVFSPTLLPIISLLTIAYISHVACYYFFVKWVPTIVFDMGFSSGESADVLVVAMVGLAIGGVAFGIIASFFDPRGSTVVLLISSAMVVSAFGQAPPDMAKLLALGALCGFFMSGAMTGLMVILARQLPTAARASGIGFVTGTGRALSALGPSGGGFLLESGISAAGTMMIMAAGSLISALAIVLLSARADKSVNEIGVQPPSPSS